MSEIFGSAGMSSRKNPEVRIQNLYNDDFKKMNVQHRTSNVQCRMNTKTQYRIVSVSSSFQIQNSMLDVHLFKIIIIKILYSDSWILSRNHPAEPNVSGPRVTGFSTAPKGLLFNNGINIGRDQSGDKRDLLRV